jgi:hypothetical protein
MGVKGLQTNRDFKGNPLKDGLMKEKSITHQGSNAKR